MEQIPMLHLKTAPFSAFKTEISNTFVDKADPIYTAMPMYNLIEHSSHYSDTSGSLWQYKRAEMPANDADLTTTGSESFNYNTDFIGKTIADEENPANIF